MNLIIDAIVEHTMQGDSGSVDGVAWTNIMTSLEPKPECPERGVYALGEVPGTVTCSVHGVFPDYGITLEMYREIFPDYQPPSTPVDP